MVPLLGHQLNTFRKFANLKCCYFTALKKDILTALKKNYSQWSRSNRISSAAEQGLPLSILQKPWTLITEKFIHNFVCNCRRFKGFLERPSIGILVACINSRLKAFCS